MNIAQDTVSAVSKLDKRKQEIFAGCVVSLQARAQVNDCSSNELMEHILKGHLSWLKFGASKEKGTAAIKFAHSGPIASVGPIEQK